MSQARYTCLPPQALDTLENLSLKARFLVEGGMLGLHRSPFRGFSSEFAEYRKYSPGDSVKHIDWKTYARSDRYYIKCFEEETNLRCCVLLDTSASMGMAADGKGRALEKFHFACSLAAAFLLLCCRQRDAFGLWTWAEQPGEFRGFSSTQTHWNERIAELEHLQPAGESRTEECLLRMAPGLPRRSLVIVISDFFDRSDRFLQVLRQLVFQHCEILLFQVLNDGEEQFPFTGLTRFEDLETGHSMELEADAMREWYLSRLRNYNRKIRLFCDEQKIPFETLSSSTPFERALACYFTKRETLF